MNRIFSYVLMDSISFLSAVTVPSQLELSSLPTVTGVIAKRNLS